MMGPIPVPRFPKCTRTSPDGSHSIEPAISKAKRERSPSPLLLERRLVTSGTKRFAPIPNDCLPSCTGYRRNRSEWVARCVTELEALNLVSERKLIRDDGLTIDWRSHVPVWSDTLKPDPLDLAAAIVLAHRSNAQWHRPSTRKASDEKSATPASAQGCSTLPTAVGDVSDVELLWKKKLPASCLSPKCRKDSSQPNTDSSPSGRPDSSPSLKRPRLPDETECKTASQSPSRGLESSLADCVLRPSVISPQHSQVADPRKPFNSAFDRPIATRTHPAAGEAMSEMTLDYLWRYIQAYEVDRASLGSAYAGNASFAYRVHQISQNTSQGASSGAASPQCLSSGLKQSRLDIVTTLLSLPCLHWSAHSPDVAHVEYEVLYLGADLGMFVVCRMVTAAKTVVHNFILQRKEADVEDAVTGGVWPLMAAAHQILVFQA